MEQVVVAEACTTRAGGQSGLLQVRGGQRGVQLPRSQCSPARRTGDRAQHMAHYHVQIRGDEGGKGALHPYEFEHDPHDPDEECDAGGCPSSRIDAPPRQLKDTAG